MNEVRINLIGTAFPWWNSNIQFGEIRVVSGRSIFRTYSRLERYARFIEELRHATMLEF